ncbi:cell wall hydrolase [Sphingomonas profundi]|uniref:cell wall hydrolase n=1 Tax=Alterirhizorhabdus profundi TaxID=2681549 RepID=UPI0012E9233B|nr:cell wall hydrolase [Sphingomonas profundi]
MSLSGHTRLLAAGALIAVTVFPATFFASDALLAATFSTDTPQPTLALDDAALQADDDMDVVRDADTPQTAASDEIDAELECMAKVVLHEAGNQPRAGQLAVAQLIVNRMESGRFADTACGVVNQPGQFFQTASYNPRRDTDAWAAAVEVSREAQARQTADVAPGAMFFRAAYAAPTGFFRTRTRVVTLGDHVFYR